MKNSILRSTSVVSVWTFISRVFGLLRDVLFARFFGATFAYDAFLVAFRIPNMTRRLFAEGAFSQAFVPILSEYKVKKSQKEVLDLVVSATICLFAVLAVITAAVIIFAPQVINLFAPGFIADELRYDLAKDMLQITFVYSLLIAISSLLTSLLNVYGVFWSGAASPIILNLTLIYFAVYVSPLLDVPVVALAWGVLVGGILQLVFKVPMLMYFKLIPRFRFSWQSEGVKRIFTNILPALIGASVMQLNILIDSVFASFLEHGSISWLYYADRVIEFPVGVFGIALATVALPNLSKDHALQRYDEFNKKINWALRSVLLIGVPATAGLALLSSEITVTLFAYGKFAIEDVYSTSCALSGYSIGLIFFLASKILISAFYAKQQVDYPFKVAIISLLVSIGANVVLIPYFNYAGIAISTAIASFVNVICLLMKLIKDRSFSFQASIYPFAAKVLFGTLLIVLVILLSAKPIAIWYAWSFIHRITILMMVIFSSIFIYFAALVVLGIRPNQLLNIE